MRISVSTFLIALGPAMLALNGPASADGATVRIVTEQYYGAVTTVEHGVRVIRPLPADRYVIVNPNRTPLALNFNENKIYDFRSNTTANRRSNVGARNPDGPVYTYPSYGPGFWKGHHGAGHIKHGHSAAGPHGQGSPGAVGMH